MTDTVAVYVATIQALQDIIDRLMEFPSQEHLARAMAEVNKRNDWQSYMGLAEAVTVELLRHQREALDLNP